MNDASQVADLQSFSEKLQKYLGKAQKATGYLLGLAGKGETEKYLADATLYLEMFGIITIAWQWLSQGIVAHGKLNDAHEADQNFYQGKLATMRYFYEYELVKVDSLVKRLQSEDSVTIEMKSEWF